MFENNPHSPHNSPHNPNESHATAAAIPRTGIEATFFGKVMAFFALAVFTSALGTFVAYNYFIDVFINTPALMYLLFAGELAIIFTSRLWRTHSPLNKLMFALFAFITGVTLAPILWVLASSPGGTAIVTKALLATGLTFTATGVLGWTTKRNLASLGGFLMMALFGMITVGVIGIFIPWGNAFEMIFSGVGVLLFSGFIVVDFNRLKHYPQDAYIDAAMALYLDIFNLFLYILRFVMSLSGRN